MTTSPRSALLAAWGTAWLSGEVSLPDAVARVTAADDDHVVTGLGPDDVTLEQALGRLRAGGAVRVRVVLPAPGDVSGLPGPGPFSTAATAASEGALALRADGTGTGLVPAVTAHGSEYDGTVTTVRWAAFAVPDPVPDRGPWLHDAEHDLRVGLAEAARRLRDLDVARWRPDVADGLASLREEGRRGLPDDELPDGHPQRARELLVQARRLAGVLALAGEDSGGAVDTRETAAREAALRELGGLVRRARLAAYNAYGLDR